MADKYSDYNSAKSGCDLGKILAFHLCIQDDPICVASQRDGKVLVTGLWVDHSLDTGSPVDPSSVMYRPLRGKDGIPEAKSLIFCLTGYQKQDRDDIMTMVGLMGASFSKPLVAEKVTHLICYKFEGVIYIYCTWFMLFDTGLVHSWGFCRQVSFAVGILSLSSLGWSDMLYIPLTSLWILKGSIMVYVKPWCSMILQNISTHLTHKLGQSMPLYNAFRTLELILTIITHIEAVENEEGEKLG